MTPGFTIGNRTLWETALLRIGYLILFRVFGYWVLTHSNMLLVRNQINNPKQAILPPSWIQEQIHFSENPETINIIHKPEEMRSFLVVFQVTTSLTKNQTVIILPSPKEPGLGIYNWLQEHPRMGGSDFTVEAIISDPNFITDPKLFCV